MESPKKGQQPRRVGYLKMKVIEDLNSETIDEVVKDLASDAEDVDTDDSTSYMNLKRYVPGHNPQIIPKEKVGEVIPLVHIVCGVCELKK